MSGSEAPLLRGPVDSSANTRIYVGNIPKDVTRGEIEELFTGFGTIRDMRLMDGFGFIEFTAPQDAEDVAKEFHHKEFKGKKILVELSRGGRKGFEEQDRARERDRYNRGERPRANRPKIQKYRVHIEGLPPSTSWQDLKDLLRGEDVEVQYAQVDRRTGEGAFVEFESEREMNAVVEKFQGHDYSGNQLSLRSEVQTPPPQRERSRSPRRFGGRSFRGGYRERSSYEPRPFRDEYDRRSDYRGAYPSRYGREPSPPRGRPLSPGMYRRERSPFGRGASNGGRFSPRRHTPPGAIPGRPYSPQRSGRGLSPPPMGRYPPRDDYRVDDFRGRPPPPPARHFDDRYGRAPSYR